MDLETMVGAILRHKIISVAVILATFAALAGVYLTSEPVYQARSSLVMIPPAPPTEEEANDPALEGRDNPYARFGDLSIVAAIVSAKLMGQVTRDELAAQGVDPRYEIGPSDRFGAGRPVVDVLSYGSSNDAALEDNEFLVAAFNDDLEAVQAEENTLPRFMLTTRAVDIPSRAEPQLTSRLRSLFAVAALGALALLTAISIADTLGPRSRNATQGGRRRASKTKPAAEDVASEHSPGGPVERSVGTAVSMPDGQSRVSTTEVGQVDPLSPVAVGRA